MINYIKNLFSKTQSVLRKGTVETLCMVVVPLFLLAVMSCTKLKDMNLPTNEGGVSQLIVPVFYVVGYDVNCGVEIQDSTAKARGYVLVSENLTDTLVAYNLPDSLFIFPADIMPKNIFGFNLFPQEYRFEYKVQMNYQPMTEEEWQEAHCPAIALYPMLFHFEPTYIIITSIFKIN